MPNAIRVGDNAPDLTLPDTNLKPQNLKEFLAKMPMRQGFHSFFFINTV
jgi:peroxiredoxin